jgi:hypothetical protein
VEASRTQKRGRREHLVSDSSIGELALRNVPRRWARRVGKPSIRDRIGCDDSTSHRAEESTDCRGAFQGNRSTYTEPISQDKTKKAKLSSGTPAVGSFHATLFKGVIGSRPADSVRDKLCGVDPIPLRHDDGTIEYKPIELIYVKLMLDEEHFSPPDGAPAWNCSADEAGSEAKRDCDARSRFGSTTKRTFLVACVMDRSKRRTACTISHSNRPQTNTLRKTSSGLYGNSHDSTFWTDGITSRKQPRARRNR